jgi:hypothetical protein
MNRLKSGWQGIFPDFRRVGIYQAGAAFWAGNRSLKTPPTCTNASVPAWQQGCADNRDRLSLVDVRRKTDPNYWWGWNSL